MKKILLITAALFSISTAAAQLTPSYVIEAITKDTELVSRGTPACDKVEATQKSNNYPVNKSSYLAFVKTYKFTFPTVLDSFVKYKIEQAVGKYNNVKWYDKTWEPFRIFNVEDDAMNGYTFYVKVIAPEDSELFEIDYTAVCITALKLK